MNENLSSPIVSHTNRLLIHPPITLNDAPVSSLAADPVQSSRLELPL
jgi:hypothetical protein